MYILYLRKGADLAKNPFTNNTDWAQGAFIDNPISAGLAFCIALRWGYCIRFAMMNTYMPMYIVISRFTIA